MMNDLAKEIMEWRKSKGFVTPHSIDASFANISTTNAEMMLGKLMLVVTEVAEAAEEVRDGNMDNFKEEMADIFIRCLDICATTGIDIEHEIEKKMVKNQNRETRHGRQVYL